MGLRQWLSTNPDIVPVSVNPDIARRLEVLPSSEIAPWAESGLYAVGRYLLGFQREGKEEYLAEAEMSAETVLACVRELRNRSVRSRQ